MNTKKTYTSKVYQFMIHSCKYVVYLIRLEKDKYLYIFCSRGTSLEPISICAMSSKEKSFMNMNFLSEPQFSKHILITASVAIYNLISSPWLIKRCLLLHVYNDCFVFMRPLCYCE